MAQNFKHAALNAALVKNAALPANCFTVGRFGEPVVGIELSLERGSDELRPLQPHILLGGYRLHRDAYRGCLYEMAADKRTATVLRAETKRCVSTATGKVFYTLTNPTDDKVSFSLVKLNTTLPYAKGPVMVNGRPLRLYAGHKGGTTIGADGWEALVQLAEGESLDIFFEDGAVRRYLRQGSQLEERFLKSEEQLDLRIEKAWEELERVLSFSDGAREKAVAAILSGVADLFHLTTRFDARGLGQGMRMTLIRNFFLELAPEALQLCHRKVTAILHQVDPSLLAMLRAGAEVNVASVDPLPASVTDIDDARKAREKALREAQREARRLERQAAQPKKGPSGGSKKNQTSNPKRLAKQERKLAQRR